MHSHEEIQKHVKVYLTVFAALAGLTVLTVWVSYWHLTAIQAILAALLIATVKGSLVVLFFMHLITEKWVIYALLALTVLFFGLVLLGPVMSPVEVPVIQ